ncbi:hypothetical protein B0H14DRAFT_2614796 [Mycena olivaceomarginata]|nr:hypothetical protein B0H14DRAFT_2614796 [Mycena olivaceomarginata]
MHHHGHAFLSGAVQTMAQFHLLVSEIFKKQFYSISRSICCLDAGAKRRSPSMGDSVFPGVIYLNGRLEEAFVEACGDKRLVAAPVCWHQCITVVPRSNYLSRNSLVSGSGRTQPRPDPTLPWIRRSDCLTFKREWRISFNLRHTHPTHATLAQLVLASRRV